MKKLVYSLFCCLCILSAHAQWKWHNPMEAGFPVLQNQGFVNEIGKTYTRLPERVKGDVDKTLWGLSQHSSGLAIHFYSNAPKIQVRYTVTGKNFGDAEIYSENDEGKIVKSTKEGHSSADIIIEGEGLQTPSGIKINKGVYGVGHSMAIKVGNAKVYGKISGIEVIE